MDRKALRRSLPIPAIFIILIILASIGVSYGLWSEILIIDGTVQTGEVYAEWIDCWCMDMGDDPRGPVGNLKDVGSTTCTIDVEDPRIMHVTVFNGYPSYYNDCKVSFMNSGTVPVVIRGWRIVPINFTLASANGAEDGEIWIRTMNGVGAQMEPCPADNCEQSGNLAFHVEQPALENYEYKFLVELCVSQWNESATMDECLMAAP
jgi:hypothetical protein